MATTFTLISTVTVGSGGAASIDFTSIPATYTDLCLKLSLRCTTGSTYYYDAFGFKFNGSTSGYSDVHVQGNGSTASSFSNTGAVSGRQAVYSVGASSTASTFSNCEMMIPNYAGSNYKSISTDSVTENNGSIAQAILSANLWANTSAITSISLFQLDAATIGQYSSASLYGILKA